MRVWERKASWWLNFLFADREKEREREISSLDIQHCWCFFAPTIHGNFPSPVTRATSIVEGKYGWSETPCTHVYTHKGWDRWRKRTRALRNTRLAFCRAASAFIKESLAPSLSSTSSCSPRFSSSLASFFPSLSPRLLLRRLQTNIGASLFRFTFVLFAVAVSRSFPPL